MGGTPELQRYPYIYFCECCKFSSAGQVLFVGQLEAQIQLPKVAVDVSVIM